MAKQKEAWDKLSMLEKALLIRLSIDNGVSSLKLIRDTYNLYSNGGNLAHKHDGNSDTQYLRTEQPEVVMPVTGKTADTSWYEWWFANRQKQLHQNIETVKKNDRERDFTKYFIAYPNAEEDTKRMIKALGETKEYVGNAGMMEDSIGNSLARNVLASDIADYTPNISDDDVNLYLSYLQDGVHLPAYNSILYPGRYKSPSKMTVTHERAHAADAFFPRSAINYFTTAGEVNPEKYDTWYKRIFAPLHPKYPLGIYPSSGKRDSYLDNPNEVYSRLMEFRQFVGANPNYTWTKDDLKKYEPALNKFELRRYSDNDILKLLNEIAQNNSGFQKSKNTYLAAFGGPLTHKKSGEELGESQELNTKTYKEKKESSAYPMHYNVLSLSLGDTSLSGAILRALIHKNAEDPNIYTGSYYFGDKWGFGTSLELPQNRNLISLYLDGDTTGFKQFNGKPIVLDGDTLTQTLYEGTLLPLDTIYLRPESKATIARMAKDKDLLKINNSFPGWMSYSSKYNFLDSPYFLDKYEGKVMDDANNLNISFKQNSDGSYYADVFDLWDLTGTGGYKAGARLEKKLAEDSIENNGPFILRLHIPIVFNKDSVSDGRFLDAISVGQWQKEIDATNQKSTGGPLYPFSFEKNPFLKTPIVRY